MTINSAASGRRSTPLPAGLGGRPLRTVRPQDAGDVYPYPGPEFARLAARGVLHRAANGYYVVVPQEHLGRPWLPNLEATAAGIASSIYGPANAIIMGVSAARVLGAIPRALAAVIITVPEQHRPIRLVDRAAVVRFVKRNGDPLDVERVETPLGPALVTTVEQTILDLAHRPALGHAEPDIPAAIISLYPRSDQRRLAELATGQGRMAALRRAQAWAGAAR
ncbi:hypothetical protein KIH27_17930 [Mycobacterium sp. M1]|uniref:AbiEi antitoxin C-terminal domain-containing protein n=1 Tax=Mycolicibacter acidiphilus TaxID=2835306 RepID=A0ABS5RME1_9MYCO|nr:hypothetical protein [Mycolicibacter acidiphilus]MBS9535468.1 hypothetical protein [Mycolicibacter acidiphilus]